MTQPYDESQLVFFDSQLVFFDADRYWRDPEIELLTEVEAEPEPLNLQQQLGWDRIRRGNIAHIKFEALMVELGAAVSRPNADPGGGTATDTVVAFEGRNVTVQVKSALIKDGRAKFNDLGPREGVQTAGRDTRRRLGYIGRADFFALAVFEEGVFITAWYLIPASKLRGHVTLTVTPGKRSLRKRKNFLEPERFRDAWYLVLDVPSSVLQGTPTTSSVLQGTPTNA